MNKIWQWFAAAGVFILGLLTMMKRERKAGVEQERTRQREVDWSESKKIEEATGRVDRDLSGLTDDRVQSALEESGGLRDSERDT